MSFLQEVVLIYGGMPESIFGQFKERTNFVYYPDWISTKRRRSANGDRLFR